MMKVISLKFYLSNTERIESIQLLENKTSVSKNILHSKLSVILAIIVANLISLGCYIVFRAHTKITYVSGCEGPETFFAMIPAFLLCIYFRILHRD